MKFAEYLKELNELAIANPKTLEMEVVSSADDEGNHYNPVHYTASVGIFIGDEYDFIGLDDEEYLDEMELTADDANAICVN